MEVHFKKYLFSIFAFLDFQLRYSRRSVWNCLLSDIRRPDLSNCRFRQSLKTFLFGQRDQSAVWIPPPF